MSVFTRADLKVESVLIHTVPSCGIQVNVDLRLANPECISCVGLMSWVSPDLAVTVCHSKMMNATGED